MRAMRHGGREPQGQTDRHTARHGQIPDWGSAQDRKSIPGSLIYALMRRLTMLGLATLTKLGLAILLMLGLASCVTRLAIASHEP